MSEVLRLTLLAHGMTEAMAARRFPADEPLSPLGIRQVAALGDLGGFDRVLAAPEARTRQTAERLGWKAELDAALADLDCGSWRGESVDDLPVDYLEQWLSDPDMAPHGGESVTGLIDRVGAWLESLSGTRGAVVAVTHPAVIRAALLVALDAPPKSFWRIDIAPASLMRLHHRGGNWTLRMGSS